MEISKEDDVYHGLPSDSEPVLQEDWENMSGDYCITVPEDTLTISDVTDIGDLITVDTNNIDWSNISINTNINTHMEGDIVFQREGEEPVHVLETLREQKLQIEALTDMIGEMVKTKNFDIDWDLSKRVEQKRFIKKLSE